MTEERKPREKSLRNEEARASDSWDASIHPSRSQPRKTVGCLGGYEQPH